MLDLLFGSLCFILLVVFLYIRKQEPTRPLPDRFSVLRNGLVVEGTIVGVETHGLRFFDEFPTVQFRTPQGQLLTLTCQESTRGPGFRKGQKVKVRFFPNFPEQFIVVSGFDFLLE